MGTPARFAVAQRSTAECLGLFAAAQRLFERRGVDFHLVAFETAAERGVEGLIASEWDYIEIGVIPLVGLRADGYDPAIVVGTTAMNTNFLMGRRNITRVVELAGGRVGCLSLGGQTAAAARAVLGRNGIADAVELVPLGRYSKIFGAISAGDIDGAILAGDFRFFGEVRHGMHIIADIGSEIRMPGTCVVTTRREIARNPELAKQIVGTYVDAVHAFKTYPDIAKSFLHNHLEFEEDVIERIYEYYRSIFQTVPRPSLPHIQVAIDEIAKVRPDVRGMAPANLIETCFLDEIDAELR
jgi:ABC-type nitrate/sulfonate/bicarbonate transport system substrate-binding protein